MNMRVQQLLIADTTLLRLLLAIIALLWAILLLFPHSLHLRFVDIDNRLVQQGWAMLWLMLAALKLWRLLDVRICAHCDLATHSFSVLMFASSVVASYEQSDPALPLPADMADDLGCIIASIWLLVRTTAKE